MTWLAWRQHRASIFAAGALLGALAVFLLLTGLQLRHQFEALGLDQCAPPVGSTCAETARRFQQQFSGYQFLIPLLLVLPALVGVFWGAPLVAREIEHGTHRLVWTQSVTRYRWLAVKLALLGLATMAGLAAMTAIVSWWVGPLMALRATQFNFGIFDLFGLAPAAYGLAALAIGLAAGTLSRRVMVAMGVTLVVFLGLRIGVEFGLRPHYMEPVTTTSAFPTGFGQQKSVPGELEDPGWILSQETVDAAGRVISSDGVGFSLEALVAECPELPAGKGVPPDPRAATACALRNGFQVVTTYQPTDRYWRFQITEAVIYLAFAGALVGTSAWWMRHRIY